MSQPSPIHDVAGYSRLLLEHGYILISQLAFFEILVNFSEYFILDKSLFAYNSMFILSAILREWALELHCGVSIIFSTLEKSFGLRLTTLKLCPLKQSLQFHNEVKKNLINWKFHLVQHSLEMIRNTTP